MMVKAATLPLLALLVTECALGTPYWVAYEGDDFPEAEGWERHTSGGGAVRSLLDGVLTLDSLQSPLIFDDYFWRRQLNPGPQELFVCEWRVRVTEAYGPLD